MRGNLKICALIALALVVRTNCVTVSTTDNQNVTSTIEPKAETTPMNESLNATESLSIESRIVNSEEISEYQVTTSATTTHKIPPTLVNTRLDYIRSSSENPAKSLKDYAKPTVAQFHPNKVGQSIDDKVKLAVINSKEHAFKNLNSFNSKSEVRRPADHQDQIAKPNEVQPDVSKENPKEFLASPELRPIRTPENHLQDHFSPMNHYYRPAKQDARFPTETPFSTSPILDTRWLGGSRPPPTETMRPPPPIDFTHPSTFHQARNTHVDHSFHHTNHHFQRPVHQDERVSFPIEENVHSEEYKPQNWPSQTQVPSINYKKTKGTWKWIPDEDYELKNSSYSVESEQRFTQYGYETPRPPQTVPSRDRPYSFDSFESNVYGNLFQNTPPPPPTTFHSERYTSAPAAWPSSGGESLQTTEEYTSGKHDDSGKHANVDSYGKYLRRPSPWKKIIHVMTAAIPIGLIISALTPRIVYVHPNATVPTLQPPILPNQQFPNQQFPNQQQGNTGQVNGPFPIRQRSVFHNDESIDASLTHFLKMMEKQYNDKHQRHGEKLDGMCEDRFFCEIALMGRQPNADALHRMLYNVALETPDEHAKKSGLGEIFTAIKRQNCEVFKCKKST